MDFSFVDTIFDPLWGRQVKRWVLELPGAGCEWYKKSGGCTMCGFNRATHKYTFGGRLYPHWIFMAIFYYAYWLIRREPPEQLVIYNGGSFLNDREIPLQTQLAILLFVRRHPTVKKVLVETRAEFVTSSKLEQYRQALGGKELEIAFGLESANDQVRNDCLHKGMSRDVFERAVDLCSHYGFKTFAYVFLKPHCLDEKQAIRDAIDSIGYCFYNGVSEVSLSCAFVQAGTPLERDFRQGRFQPPKLWSIIEVIRKTAGSGPVRIGSFDDTPPPVAQPSNCAECDEVVLATINVYRRTHDLSVFDGLDCKCRDNS